MKTIVKFITVILVVASLATCARSDPPPNPTSDAREVTGFITEIEAGTMSLRSKDNSKQFIFSLENPPVPAGHLQEHMDQRLPVVVTYRVEQSRLIPITIEDA